MKPALFTPILFFIVFLLIVYLVVPKIGELGDLKGKVTAAETELQTAHNYLKDIQDISANLDSYGDALNRLQSALPEEFSLASLLGFFQEKVEESGLVLKSIGQASGVEKQGGGAGTKEKEEEAKPKTGPEAKHIIMSLKGSVSSFEDFIKGLEKSSRLIEVEVISFQQNPGQLPGFTLLVKVYSQ